MTTQAQDIPDELRRLIAGDQISEEALHAITGIESQKLRVLLANASLESAGMTTGAPALSAEESTRVSILAAQLTYVREIDDDERLQAILESLTIECRLTLRNIALLTGLDIDDLKTALDDPRAVPIEKKFVIALKGSCLINAASQARPR